MMQVSPLRLQVRPLAFFFVNLIHLDFVSENQSIVLNANENIQEELQPWLLQHEVQTFARY